jgi:hypothetical protein
MRYIYIILAFFFLNNNVFSQIENRAKLSAISAQFAGSVGFWSVGYHRVFYNEKLSLGLVYGNTPKRVGGKLHSVSFKLKYSPFRISLYKQFSFEPFQAGFFLVQNFGENLRSHWPSRYKGRYYWWGNSFRQHVFLSSQLSVGIEKGFFRRVGAYFEANTNDLYMYSYLSNMNSLRFYDIVFFGIGIQATVR